MELLELYNEMLRLFSVEDCSGLERAMMDAVIACDVEKYDKASKLFPDLEHDWLQKIFQYYRADRDEKKQDFTPSSLAQFLAALTDGDSQELVDMCAGSGALTIQAWVRNKNRFFRLYELDGAVIPYLLFNLAVRNMNAEVLHGDVLSDKKLHKYTVTSGNKYSTVSVENYDDDEPDKQPAVQRTVAPSGKNSQFSLLGM